MCFCTVCRFVPTEVRITCKLSRTQNSPGSPRLRRDEVWLVAAGGRALLVFAEESSVASTMHRGKEKGVSQIVHVKIAELKREDRHEWATQTNARRMGNQSG